MSIYWSTCISLQLHSLTKLCFFHLLERDFKLLYWIEAVWPVVTPSFLMTRMVPRTSAEPWRGHSLILQTHWWSVVCVFIFSVFYFVLKLLGCWNQELESYTAPMSISIPGLIFFFLKLHTVLHIAFLRLLNFTKTNLDKLYALETYVKQNKTKKPGQKTKRNWAKNKVFFFSSSFIKSDEMSNHCLCQPLRILTSSGLRTPAQTGHVFFLVNRGSVSTITRMDA